MLDDHRFTGEYIQMIDRVGHDECRGSRRVWRQGTNVGVGAPAANSDDPQQSRAAQSLPTETAQCAPPGGGSPIACCAAIANFSSPVALDEAGATSYTNLVWPGMATGATASAASHSSFAGMRLSVEFNACSQVTACQV